MKKSLIILGCVIAVIIILFVIKSFSTTSINNEDYLNKYLKDNDYKEENGVYVKVASDDDEIKDTTSLDEYTKALDNNSNAEYTTLSLDKEKFTFKRENRTYSDDMEKIYNGSIELKEEDTIKFDYMINIYTSQIMVEGTYVLKNENGESDYKCSLFYQSGLEDDEEETEHFYCLLAKVETLDFVKNINDLKSDKKLFSMIKE